jgi:chorismate mutase/prephenate dehydratase
MSADEMARLRKAIDEVDDQLLAGLNRRAELARAVGEWKARHAQPFYVPQREAQIVERLTAANPGPFPSDGIRPVFSAVVSACLSLERRLVVAFLGPEATVTHQASRGRFGWSARYSPVGTMAGVLDEVARGAADLGVIPVESAAEGVVARALDLLALSPLSIVQEIVEEAPPCLLSRWPGDAVRKVYAHPQVLALARGWVAVNLPQATAIEVASTALAARLAREEPAAAAIAPELAAELYDLPVAARAACDELPAPTRFLVAGPASAAPPPSGRDKTTLLLAVADAPGALAKVLALFHGLNLSDVESRPPRRAAKRAWESGYAFVDLEGHAADPAVATVLARLRDEGALVRVLGSYPLAPEPAP